MPTVSKAIQFLKIKSDPVSQIGIVCSIECCHCCIENKAYLPSKNSEQENETQLLVDTMKQTVKLKSQLEFLPVEKK